MSATISISELDLLWLSIIQQHPMQDWSSVENNDLPIPHEQIELAAFFRFVERGRSEGYHLHDWLTAEAALRHQFRDAIRRLQPGEEVVNVGTSVQDLDGSRPIPSEERVSQTRKMSCARSGKGDKPKIMRKPIRNIPSDDPRVTDIREYLRNYRDGVRRLTEADRAAYRGKLLAILCDTGEIIAAAENAKALREVVAESKFANRDWRIADGPTGESPLPLSEAADGGSGQR